MRCMVIMSIQNLFPTQIYVKKLNFRNLHESLRKEIAVYEQKDDDGIEWSKKNYPQGYTSYSSLSDLHFTSSHFIEFRKKTDQEVKKYIKALKLNLLEKELVMTTCWVNVMQKGCAHSFHFHPHCVVSGTYYVDVKSTDGIRFEDPKSHLYMSRPPSKSPHQLYYSLKPKNGTLVLFESWLKHEVPRFESTGKRVSISFNYEWV